MYKSPILPLLALFLAFLMSGNEGKAQKFRRFGKGADTIRTAATVQDAPASMSEAVAPQVSVPEGSTVAEQSSPQSTPAEAVAAPTFSGEPSVVSCEESRPTVDLASLRARYQNVAASRIESDGYVRVVQNGRQALIDSHGNEVLPLEYDNIGHNNFIVSMRDNYLPICRNSLYGVIDKRGRIIVPPISREPVEKEIERQGYAPVCVNGKWGLVDTLGQYVVTPRFDEELVVAEAYSDDAFLIRVLSVPFNQSGLIQGGRLVQPFLSDSIAEPEVRFRIYKKIDAEAPKITQQVEYYY